MRNNLEMALKISSELITYCHHHGATYFDTKLIEGPDALTLIIHSYPVELSDFQMENLVRNLKAPRQGDVENDYWELIGASEDFSELMLVGISCDEAYIEFKDNVITIKLIRKY